MLYFKGFASMSSNADIVHDTISQGLLSFFVQFIESTSSTSS